MTVAAFLLDSGASIRLVRTFLKPLREQIQVTTFREVMNDLVHRKIRGHSVLLSYTELDGPRQGLNAVVEKVFEVEHPDVYFAVFAFNHNRSVVIISRNQKDSIELNRLMEAFGGGGHPKAASASIKQADGREVYEKLLGFLESSLRPAITATELMTREVKTVSPGSSLLDVSIFLEGINHTGCPVVDENGSLVGVITLRDIMKGRQAGLMHAPVKGYMTRKVVSATPATTVREVEEILLTNDIGHLPIVEDGTLVGIITRTDYLALRRAAQESAFLSLRGVDGLLAKR